MNEATPYIGVDVSKDKLDYSISGEKAAGTCPNTAKGIRKIIGAARERNARVCCEATGGYERALLEACWAGGVEVVLTDPWRVRHFAKGKGVLEKTDAIDARIIARFACENDLRPFARPSEARRRLCDLTRAGETLDKQIQMARGQLEHCCDKAMEKLWRKNIRLLGGMRAKVDRERIAMVNGDERMRRLFERYQLVKGVGPETALSMIAEMPELGTVSDKVAGKLLGAAPIPDDSGKKTGRRLIRRGRFAARRALYMAAVSSIRFNPILRAFYLRLAKSNGKPPKVALVAVMRKLICLLNRRATRPSSLRLVGPSLCLAPLDAASPPSFPPRLFPATPFPSLPIFPLPRARNAGERKQLLPLGGGSRYQGAGKGNGRGEGSPSPSGRASWKGAARPEVA